MKNPFTKRLLNAINADKPEASEEHTPNTKKVFENDLSIIAGIHPPMDSSTAREDIEITSIEAVESKRLTPFPVFGEGITPNNENSLDAHSERDKPYGELGDFEVPDLIHKILEEVVNYNHYDKMPAEVFEYIRQSIINSVSTCTYPFISGQDEDGDDIYEYRFIDFKVRNFDANNPRDSELEYIRFSFSYTSSIEVEEGFEVEHMNESSFSSDYYTVVNATDIPLYYLAYCLLAIDPEKGEVVIKHTQLGTFSFLEHLKGNLHRA